MLGENNLLAQRNRGYFEAKNIFALNLVSSPGSGKTTLLEKTLVELKDVSSAVIELNVIDNEAESNIVNTVNVPTNIHLPIILKN